MAVTTGEILETAAKDGSIDAADWPRTLEDVLERLHVIVHTTFPRPSQPAKDHTTAPPHADPTSGPDPDRSTSNNHVPGPAEQQQQQPREPSISNGEQAGHNIGTPGMNGSSNQHSVGPHNVSELASDTQALYTSCLRTLKTTFSDTPPYTLQRLAELILQPRRHYRFLPSYLAALDQLLSVSSSTTDFPMPALHVNANSTFLSNGDTPSSSDSGLSGDESLGGALLTPIPWLKRDSGPAPASAPEPHSFDPTPDPPHDPDDQLSTHASLRAEGAVTQGELLRQEQQAGVIPVAQTRRAASHSLPEQTPDENGATHAHARGPDEIGMEDMGPQDQTGAGRPLDIEGAMGRGRSTSPQPTGEMVAGDGNGEGQQQDQRSGDGIATKEGHEQEAADGGMNGQAQRIATPEKDDEEMPDAR